MKKSYLFALSLSGLLVIALCAVNITAESTEKQPSVTVQEISPQTVLYTIYRGHYAETGQAVGKLFALAGQKKIKPRGAISYCYLNNPSIVSSEHWLTEIRIEVDDDALQYAGTLGELTDVKKLPTHKVAVIEKNDITADPSELYKTLYGWISKNGYFSTDNCCEQFPAMMTGSYDKMKTKIMLPIEKITAD